MMLSELVAIVMLFRCFVFGLEVIFLPHYHQRRNQSMTNGGNAVGGETRTGNMPPIAQMSMWVNMGFDD